jgi:exopolysaccharide production protein ExoZ
MSEAPLQENRAPEAKAALPASFQSIQHLRAVAALGVVVAHLEIYLGRMGYTGHWPGFLTSGVDIFFVISGFIMWVTTASRVITPQRFFLNRLVRIVPLYWAITAFALLVMLTNPALMQNGALDWNHVAASFLFIPYMHPVLGEPQPLVTAGWTLNFEMLFYALFALALALPRKWRLNGALCLLCGVLALRLAGPAPFGALWFYSSNIILEFGFGLLIGALITSGRRYPAAFGVLLVGLGTVLVMLLSGIAGSEHLRSVLRGLPSAMIVLGAVICERDGQVLKNRLLTFLGDASYSLYLAHGIILSAFTRMWMKLLPPVLSGNPVLFVVAGLIVATLGGAGVYRLIETPLGRGARALLRATKADRVKIVAPS